MEDDHPIVAAQQTVALEETQARRDRWSARGHQIGQHRVGEPHRDTDSERRNSTPAVGQVPQQQQQSAVDPRVVGDGHVDRQRARALHRASHQSADHLRIRPHAGGETLVQKRDAHTLQHAEAGLEGQRGILAVVLPRPQQVARAEELEAIASVAPDPSQHESFQQQQADPPAYRSALRVLGLPDADAHHRFGRDARLPGLVETVAVEALGQSRIGQENVTGSGWHDEEVPGAMAQRTSATPDRRETLARPSRRAPQPRPTERAERAAREMPPTVSAARASAAWVGAPQASVRSARDRGGRHAGRRDG